MTNRVDRIYGESSSTLDVATAQSEASFDSSAAYNISAANYSPYSYMPYNYVSMGASPFSSPPPPPPPPAMAFNLCFISGNIAKCFGCGNKYPKPPKPPYDLCVQHREWRSYTPTSGGDQQSKFSPAYYHVNLMCICNKWPMFRQHDLVVSSDVAERLAEAHNTYLVLQG